jgi:hypothetical protein
VNAPGGQVAVSPVQASQLVAAGPVVGGREVQRVQPLGLPAQRKQLPPRPSRLDPFKSAIDEMLTADLDAPRKQRHTVTRIWHRLMDEHGMTDMSYPVVRAYVAERKPQISADAGRGPSEVFLRQSHRPGDEGKSTSAMRSRKRTPRPSGKL